jgi:hypothetical protein
MGRGNVANVVPVMKTCDKLINLLIKTNIKLTKVQELGRFRESLIGESILLAIFAGEREDSIQKLRNRVRAPPRFPI